MLTRGHVKYELQGPGENSTGACSIRRYTREATIEFEYDDERDQELIEEGIKRTLGSQYPLGKITIWTVR